MTDSIDKRFVPIAVVFLLVVSLAGVTSAQTVISVRPGLISYAEGQVKLAGAGPKPSGKDIHVERGQHLLTEAGRVEVLLTPVVILRTSGSSDWEMLSSKASDVRMKLHRGSGIVEVRARVKGASISVEAAGVSVRLENKGLYRFDSFPGTNPVLTVLKGKARVSDAAGSLVVKSKRLVALGGGTLKAGKLASSAAPDALAAWHDERSALLSQPTRRTRTRTRQVAGVPESTRSAFGSRGTGAIRCENGTPELLN